MTRKEMLKTKRPLAGVQKIALLDEKIGKWSRSQMNKWKKEKLESHTQKMNRESGDTNNYIVIILDKRLDEKVHTKMTQFMN